MASNTVREKNIALSLYANPTVTSDLIKQWNNIIPILERKYIVDVKEISPVLAEKYRLDMYGLFQELEIREQHIYPHIRVNGYLSSADYLGEILRIKILDAYVLDDYIRRFSK